MASIDQRIVRRDTLLAAGYIATAALMASVTVAPTKWWVAVAAFIATSLTFAAADRSSAHSYALVSAVTVVVVLFVVAIWWLVEAPLLPVVPLALLGMGVGTALNRFLFGVVCPVPEQRCRREQNA